EGPANNFPHRFVTPGTQSGEESYSLVPLLEERRTLLLPPRKRRGSQRAPECRRPRQRARTRRRTVTVASSAVGSHARIRGSRLNTRVPLSISFCSRKKARPMMRLSPMRVPAPAARREPRMNGTASRTANAIATVRAIRDQKANTYSRASRELDFRYWIRLHRARLVSWSGVSTARPRKPAVTFDSNERCPEGTATTLSSLKRDSV